MCGKDRYNTSHLNFSPNFPKIFRMSAKSLFRGNDCFNTPHPPKMRITPLTTGYHEITPLTTKSERCYNQPPCNNFLVRTFHVCLHQNGDYRDLLKKIFCLNLESDYCGYYLEPYWRRCRFRHCQTSCLVSVHSTRK